MCQPQTKGRNPFYIRKGNFGRVQIIRLDSKAFGHQPQFPAPDPPVIVFQPSDRVSAGVPQFQLHGLGQLLLAPAFLQPELSHLGTNRVQFYFSCFDAGQNISQKFKTGAAHHTR